MATGSGTGSGTAFGRPKSETDWRAIEQEVKAAPDVDPVAILDLLKRYRDNADWDGVVRFADDLDEPLRARPDVQQIFALALNRRRKSGDRERAIGMMNDLVAKTGGDSETYGILGRIYKDCWADSGDRADLERAIAAYRAGFEKQPSDYYPAINLITLLAVAGGDEATAERRRLVPRVRELVMQRVGDRPADFWELATALQLAVLDDDWNVAATLGDRLREQAAAPWMLETTVRSLEDLGQHAILDSSRGDLDRLIAALRSDPAA